jgi:hypothetical protein
MGEDLSVTVDEGDTRDIDSVGDARAAFRDYLRAKDGRSIVLEETATNDDIALAIPHTHRWSPEYRSKTYAKLKAAEGAAEIIWGDGVPSTMITLTAPHRTADGDHRPVMDVLSDITDNRSRVLDLVRKRLSDLHVQTEYLWVMEPHKSGYPHVHILVLGAQLPGLGDKVADMWADKYVDGASRKAQSVDISESREKSLSNPAAYLMKYLGKTLSKSDTRSDDPVAQQPQIGGYETFSAAVWISGKRTFGMSQSLRQEVTIRMSGGPTEETEYEWKLVGTTDGGHEGVYRDGDARDLISSCDEDSRRAVSTRDLDSVMGYPELDDIRRPTGIH